MHAQIRQKILIGVHLHYVCLFFLLRHALGLIVILNECVICIH